MADSSTSSSSPSRTFVLVGHCGPDIFMLRTAIERSVPDASIALANDENTFMQFLDSDHVLLINRVLDGRFHTDSGLDLIENCAAGTTPPAMVLISNLPDAQQRATAAGALPGFGKSELYDESTQQTIRSLARNMQD